MIDPARQEVASARMSAQTQLNNGQPGALAQNLD